MNRGVGAEDGGKHCSMAESENPPGDRRRLVIDLGFTSCFGTLSSLDALKPRSLAKTGEVAAAYISGDPCDRELSVDPAAAAVATAVATAVVAVATGATGVLGCSKSPDRMTMGESLNVFDDTTERVELLSR
jgi:hypothetical protein